MQTNYQNCEVSSEIKNLLKLSRTQSAQKSQENQIQKLDKIKPRMEVQYNINKEDPWKTATIVSRGGEAAGKYDHHWNKTDQNGEKVIINFSSVRNWETLPTIELCKLCQL